jgi:hypothetical protein
MNRVAAERPSGVLCQRRPVQDLTNLGAGHYVKSIRRISMKAPMLIVSSALLFYLLGAIASSQDIPPDTHKGKAHRPTAFTRLGQDPRRSQRGVASGAGKTAGGIDPMAMPEPERSRSLGKTSTSGVAGAGTLPARTIQSGKRQHTRQLGPHKR